MDGPDGSVRSSRIAVNLRYRLRVDIARWGRRWLASSSCRFCTAALPEPGVCAPCRRALPWNDGGCSQCGLPLRTAEAGVCGSCRNAPPPFRTTVAPFIYAAPVRRLITDLKYHAEFSAAAWLGHAIATTAAERSGLLPDCLIPVPLHASRLRTRGYNQALLLARAIRQRLAIDIDDGCAHRLRPTADQIGQDAEARRREVRGAFAIAASIAGRHVALIDDVMTTGSTVRELAKAALRAGAARVEVWVAARVP